ncbi:MAG: hypothetical protein FWE70_08590, partial [Oscillospiraceae bacterium]|nr:hypothetical protein [Oscillospiraceae bacterium]
MPASMTGYGKARAEFGGGAVEVELRSVNGRQLDLSMRMPKALNALEDRVRRMVAGRLRRGKVDLHIYVDGLAADRETVSVDAEALRSYAESLRGVAVGNPDIKDDLGLSFILGLPGVLV